MPLPDRGTTHIIGAGLAGLAAAIRLADRGQAIVIHEATEHAGGRCRSYFDDLTGMLIDNGTHLVLSGNHAARAFLRTVGTEERLKGPVDADYPFVDLATNRHWKLSFGNGFFPWWIFRKRDRVPGTRTGDYLSLARLAWAPTDKPLGETMSGRSAVYQRLIAPFFLAALNIEPLKGSTKLIAAIIRETIAKGGKASRPLMAEDGIGNVFIQPALDYLGRRDIAVQFKSELVTLGFAKDRVAELKFIDRIVPVGDNDDVILAVPAFTAKRLMPDLRTPSSFRPIVNVHFRVDAPESFPPMIGVINGTSDWIFSGRGKISVTISDAQRVTRMTREAIAQKIWEEVAAITKLPSALPPWQIVREPRATFAATPEENASRPQAETKWHNLFLAGDWTATGLPATLEGAIRSGNRAADLVRRGERAAA
jgi:squalene-associated FAD-dependent desaturase